LVLPFGVKQAPSFFQQVVESVLRPYLTHFCQCYIDDIIIYSVTAAEHLNHISLVLAKLKEAKFNIKLEKSTFFQTKVEFLGWIVGRDGREIHPKHVKAITTFQKPMTAPQMSRFTGMIAHVRDIIDQCSMLTAPLHEATKGKDIRKRTQQSPHVDKIVWTPAMEQAYKTLIYKLTHSPTLKIVDIDKPFFIEKDASDVAVAASLWQPYGDKLHPVMFYSRKLNDTEKKWHIIEKEALALHEPILQWQKYIGSQKVIVHGDSSPVQAIIDMKKSLKPKHLRWLLNLQSVNLTYKRIKSKENVFADALTRDSIANAVYTCHQVADLVHEEPFSEYIYDAYMADMCFESIEEAADKIEADILPTTPMSTLTLWIHKIKESYKDDTLAQAVLNNTTSPETQLLQVVTEGKNKGIIFKRSSVPDQLTSLYVPNIDNLRLNVMAAHHGTTFAAHFDAKRTTSTIMEHFWWPTLAMDVAEYVKKCVDCARSKARTFPRPAIHIPFHIPKIPWGCIGMDAKTGLPLTERGNDAFWLFVDYFTGMVEIAPTSKAGNNVKNLLLLFLQYVYKNHGMPSKIVSDRDPLFTSDFWKQLWAQLLIKLNMATARNPWTDGKSERYIRTIVEVLRTFCYDNPEDWDTLLPIIQVAFNKTINPITGYSPFQLNKLADPKTPISLILREATTDLNPESAAQPYNELLDKMSKVYNDIQRAFEKISASRKRELSKRGYAPIDFKTGDLVMIENPKAKDKLQAFDQRFLGPFTLGKEIRPNQFQIVEWSNSGRHDIVNANKFKPFFNERQRQDDAVRDEILDKDLGTDHVQPNPTNHQPTTPATVTSHTILSTTISVIDEPYVPSQILSNSVPAITFDRKAYKIIFLNKDKETITDLLEIISYVLANPQDLQAKNATIKASVINHLNALRVMQRKYFTTRRNSQINEALNLNAVGNIIRHRDQLAGVVAAIDPLDTVTPFQVVYEDGFEQDLTLSATRHQIKQQQNAALFVTMQQKPLPDIECTNPVEIQKFISYFTGIKINMRICHRVYNALLGGQNFELTRVQPNDAEIKLLLNNLIDQFLGNKSGIDPTGSFGDISRALESATTTRCQTNDLNPLMVGTHDNPLHTLVLQKWSSVHDYVITSPPKDYLPALIPAVMMMFKYTFVFIPNDLIHRTLQIVKVDKHNSHLAIIQSTNHYSWIVHTKDDDISSILK
jgi:hypothetical protein